MEIIEQLRSKEKRQSHDTTIFSVIALITFGKLFSVKTVIMGNHRKSWVIIVTKIHALLFWFLQEYFFANWERFERG